MAAREMAGRMADSRRTTTTQEPAVGQQMCHRVPQDAPSFLACPPGTCVRKHLGKSNLVF